MKTVTTKLTKRVYTKLFKSLSPAWTLSDKDTSLVGTFAFSTFLDSFMFVTRVGVHAEVLRHYPVIQLAYNKVSITLIAPETKTLTETDFDLAKKLDIVFALSTTERSKRIPSH